MRTLFSFPIFWGLISFFSWQTHAQQALDPDATFLNTRPSVQPFDPEATFLDTRRPTEALLLDKTHRITCSESTLPNPNSLPQAESGSPEFYRRLLMEAGFEDLSVGGGGSQGIVFFGKKDGKSVAIKLPWAPDFSRPIELLRRDFDFEADALENLKGAPVPEIYGKGLLDGRYPYIYMKKIEGRLLSQLIRQMTDAEAVVIALRLAQALRATHGRGYIHRDIKSDNIMVTDDLQVWLLDHGLTISKQRLLESRPNPDPNHLCGTPLYWSPELTQTGVFDEDSDLWALGIVFYRMLAHGFHPYRYSKSTEQILTSLGTGEEMVPITDIRPDLPPSLRSMVEKLIKVKIGRWGKRDKRDNYKNIDEFITDLEKLVGRGEAA